MNNIRGVSVIKSLHPKISSARTTFLFLKPILKLGGKYPFIKGYLDLIKDAFHEKQWVHFLCCVAASFPDPSLLPQVAETNPPQPMDVAGEGTLYD
jgi:hypothetical protein